MWLDFSPNHPCDRREPDIQRVDGIGNLRLRDIHAGLRVVVESTIPDIAHDPDDLPLRFVLELPHDSPADDEAGVQRIVALDPVLSGHRFVNDYNRRRRAIIAIRERASPLNGNLKDIKISRRHSQPAASPMKWSFRQRPARDDERKTITS